MEEEIRKEAIVRYVNGEGPEAVCRALTRSKPWLFKWIRRFRDGDLDWYKDKPKAPLRKPKRIDVEQRQLIIATRKRLEAEPFSQIGVSAVKWELSKLGCAFPSDRTINRILKEEGLVKKNLVCTQGSRVSVLQEDTRL